MVSHRCRALRDPRDRVQFLANLGIDLAVGDVLGQFIEVLLGNS